jgi:hypothetical protein
LSNEPPEFADLTVFSPMVWHFWRVSCDMRRVPVLFPEMKSWNKHETHQPMTTYTSQHHYMFIIVAQKSAHIQDLCLSITISDHIWVISDSYPLVNFHITIVKSPCFMGKLTINGDFPSFFLCSRIKIPPVHRVPEVLWPGPFFGTKSFQLLLLAASHDPFWASRHVWKVFRNQCLIYW